MPYTSDQQGIMRRGNYARNRCETEKLRHQEGRWLWMISLRNRFILSFTSGEPGIIALFTRFGDRDSVYHSRQQRATEGGDERASVKSALSV